MEGSSEVRGSLRCYRCWSQNLQVQVHYEGIHRIDADTGERGEVAEEMQEAVIQCMECMHDQPHLAFHHGRIEPVEERWERMIAGAPWVASCTVTVDADDVETCSGPDAADALTDTSFGEHGTREFFTHVRFHKHDEDHIVIHLLVELYARSAEEATEVLDEAARGTLTITSLAEESRPPGIARRRPALTTLPTPPGGWGYSSPWLVAGAGAADPSVLYDRSGKVCVDGKHPSHGLNPLLVIVSSVGHVEVAVDDAPAWLRGLT